MSKPTARRSRLLAIEPLRLSLAPLTEFFGDECERAADSSSLADALLRMPMEDLPELARAIDAGEALADHLAALRSDVERLERDSERAGLEGGAGFAAVLRLVIAAAEAA